MKDMYDETMKIDPRSIEGNETAADIVDTTFLAYNAGRIREVCQLFTNKLSREDVLIGVSLTGALTPAGLGVSCIVPLIKNGLIDWIVSTGANLYHDLHFSLGKSLYRGSPFVDDRRLKKEGIIRIYDILCSYDVLLSTDTFIYNTVSGRDFQKKMGTAELHYLLGKYALEREKILGLQEKSILACAFEYDVPVYTPSPGDSSIGMNIAALHGKEEKISIDTMRDVNETASIVYTAKKKGMKSSVIILGGGSPKNFLLQTEPHIQEILGLQEAGHDYFVQITDARPDTGGLSGATPREAVSWGKIDPDAVQDSVVVYADTTIVLPIITSYALSKKLQKKHTRLYTKRKEMLATLMNDVDRP